MKNNILYSFFISMVTLFLSGCGSDSKINPIGPELTIAAEPYTFFNATTPLVITDSNVVNGTKIKDVYKISVQLLKYDLVDIGSSVQMKPFDFKYGNIEASIVDTDENGVATFNYTPPSGSDYGAIRGKNIILEAIFIVLDDEENTTITQTPSILLKQSFVLEFH